eukprot:gnl/TRDRNA2_/TRDRNA2_193442_c0_seq1.p1 gnl/TRDRNA2_/TRDRNA2_193442_c0~~gnl/TRDRNA2_/TRDRNA2_193442_c0_seq1.p1  ORF type:complete len:220 (+),score=49.75 gnl/TRDRNA2_/TRDRNA2_193442_c0_seq1:101-661(+)
MLAAAYDDSCVIDARGNCIGSTDPSTTIQGSQLLQTRMSSQSEANKTVQFPPPSKPELVQTAGVDDGLGNAEDEGVEGDVDLVYGKGDKGDVDLTNDKGDAENGIDDDACEQLRAAEKAYEECEDMCHLDKAAEDDTTCEDDTCKAHMDKVLEMGEKCSHDPDESEDEDLPANESGPDSDEGASFY